MTAADWIARLGLAPHPEGGHFRETYRAAETVSGAALPPRFPGGRALATAIYYLLQRGECSALHRIRADEIWHFYDGDPLTLAVLDARGALTTLVLGRDAARGETPQAVVPAGCWFGAIVEAPGAFTLVGCTVAPGFDFADFEVAERAVLLRRHPGHRTLIERLTRAAAPTERHAAVATQSAGPCRPGIVGIVNVTDDSFSDGGRYRDAADARAHARRLADAGADVVELGPAASSPDAAAVSAAEERRRLEPLLDDLLADGLAVAIDSCQPETQRWAAGRGAAWLNDVRGFPDAAVYDALAAARCRLVVMHAVQRDGRATRIATDPDAVVEGIYRFFDGRIAALVAAGLARTRLVLDPGMGYFLGADPGPSVRVLGEIPRLRAAFGLPVLLSVSRKSFLGALTGRAVGERGAATLAAELYAVMAGADWVRTHDVAALRDALTVLAALRDPR